ncbi:hypothetical protein SLA2020_235670 [Shorea laevis]
MNPRFKLFLFYFLSILVLFLAVFFSFTKTDYYKIERLKFTLTSHPSLSQSLLSFLHQTPKSHVSNPISKSSLCVLWMAPFLSGGGYSSEAWSYILALNERMKMKKPGIPRFRLGIEQHGDQESLEFWEGLPQDIKKLAFELHQTQCRMNETIVVCHSEPGAWYPPLFQTLPCPPTGYGEFWFVIGRTMFETDRVNPEHVRRCNRMDSVWVPTDFHVSSFVQSGVDPSKVVKVVQSVDVKFFDPSKYEPLDLASIGNLVLGAKTTISDLKKKFVFLSVFKWEHRKGWDVLLKAYLKEFSKIDEVVLYLLTNPYHCDRDFDNKIVEFVEDAEMEKPVEGKEAMAMALPVIVTNWSGPTEYLTEENSYPLPVENMSEVMEGPFKGHLWAEPSVSKLQALMRHVINNFEEAKAKGRQGREDMIKRFAPEIVAGIVTGHIQSIMTR